MCSTSFPGSKAEDCDESWHKFGSKCFFFNETAALSYGEAENYCQSIEATMVSLHSKEEEAFLKDHFRKDLSFAKISAYLYFRHHVWLGGKQNPPGGDVIEWSDKSSFDYSSWFFPFHPSSDCRKQGANCCLSLALNRGASWVDFNCNARYGLACQKTIKRESIDKYLPLESYNDGASSLAGGLFLFVLLAINLLVTF